MVQTQEMWLIELFLYSIFRYEKCIVIQMTQHTLTQSRNITFPEIINQGPLSLTWLNFNPSMDK